jgi:hypothetical protein
MAACDGQAWAIDVRAYRRHLAGDDPPLAPKTVRTYLTAAAGLLGMAKVERASGLEDRHVRGFLLRKVGHRANLARFSAWLPTVGGPTLQVNRKRAPNLRRLERKTLSDARSLLAALEAATDGKRLVMAVLLA